MHPKGLLTDRRVRNGELDHNPFRCILDSHIQRVRSKTFESGRHEALSFEDIPLSRLTVSSMNNLVLTPCGCSNSAELDPMSKASRIVFCKPRISWNRIKSCGIPLSNHLHGLRAKAKVPCEHVNEFKVVYK